MKAYWWSGSGQLRGPHYPGTPEEEPGRPLVIKILCSNRDNDKGVDTNTTRTAVQ